MGGMTAVFAPSQNLFSDMLLLNILVRGSSKKSAAILTK